MRFPLLSALGAAVSMAACGGGSGGSDATTAPTVKANVTYQGVFSSGVERGTISLTSGSPATGSLKVGDANAVSLTGTFTASTSTFALSGGGYSVSAQAGTGGTITGTVSGGEISGSGMLAALDATAAATPTRYCGVYTGDDAGMVEFYFMGATAVAVANGMGGGFSMTGSVNGNSATVTATKPDKSNTVTANVSFNGTTLSGSASSTAYPNEKVNITASVTACGSGAPPAPASASTYVGYAWNNGFSGLLSINTGAPATASVAWNNGAAVSLSGSYNATTGAVSVSGGGLTLTGTAGVSSFTGSLSGMTSGTSTAGVAAMASPASAPVTRYCGNVSGGIAGRMIVMQSAGAATGVFIYGLSSAGLRGTLSGGLAYLTAGTTMYIAGTGGSSGYSGTYSHTVYNAGSWSLSGC